MEKEKHNMNVYGITTVTADQTLTYLMHFDAINYLNSSLTNLFYHCSPEFRAVFSKICWEKGLFRRKEEYMCVYFC